MKLKTATLFIALFSVTASLKAQVGIGTSSPSGTAVLDLSSTSRGFLSPRMTTIQRTAIASPADGLLVYDTNTKSMWMYKTGTGWANMSDFTIPFSGNYNITGALLSLNNAGNGSAIATRSSGVGTAFSSVTESSGFAVEAIATGPGDAMYSVVANPGTGRAGYFLNNNAGNGSDVITVKTIANGIAGNFIVDRTQGTSPAVMGEVNSVFSNFGTAGIYGVSSGTGGFGGVFYSSNASGNGPAVLALTNGNGHAVSASAVTGDAIYATTNGTGTAVNGWINASGTGRAGRFQNLNPSNTNPVISAETRGTNALAVFRSGTPTAVNVARISYDGRGFFNGGTQTGGADVAEAFDVEGNINNYEPGDVLAISTATDRTVERSAGAYSTLVVGVYASRPGVLLTEEHIDTDISGKVPMGVIGVIPTKVCLEGGVINRGDLLVTSSIPGVAMKADINLVKPGQVIGKALQSFNDTKTGKINVLVNVK